MSRFVIDWRGQRYLFNMSAARRQKVEDVPEHLRELAQELPLTLNLQESADVLKMHPRSVQRLIASGELRAMRSHLSGGARIVITRSEIIRYLSTRDARVTSS
jgi:hypothetical protein